MARLSHGVAVLTLAVSALTAGAAAADEPPPPPAGGTPLNVRPSRPLELAPERSGSHFGSTAIAAIIVALGGGLWLHKRRSAGRAEAPRRTITIAARQSIGVRSELIVVEVDGQGLLLGVTPGAIQRLAVLPDVASDKPARITEDDVEPGFRVARPVDLESEPPPPPALPEPRRPLRDRAARDGQLEEQVRGLMRARRAQP